MADESNMTLLEDHNGHSCGGQYLLCCGCHYGPGQPTCYGYFMLDLVQVHEHVHDIHEHVHHKHIHEHVNVHKHVHEYVHRNVHDDVHGGYVLIVMVMVIHKDGTRWMTTAYTPVCVIPSRGTRQRRYGGNTGNG